MAHRAHTSLIGWMQCCVWREVVVVSLHQGNEVRWSICPVANSEATAGQSAEAGERMG